MPSTGIRYHNNARIGDIYKVYTNTYLVNIFEPSADYTCEENTFFVASLSTLLELYAKIKETFNPVEPK